MKPDSQVEDVWRPKHKATVMLKGGGSIEVDLPLLNERGMPDPSVESAECPRSRSAFDSGPWATQMVEEIHKARRVKEGSGAFIGGLNSDDWDAKFHDCFYLVDVQKSRVEQAESEIKRQY